MCCFFKSRPLKNAKQIQIEINARIDWESNALRHNVAGITV